MCLLLCASSVSCVKFSPECEVVVRASVQTAQGSTPGVTPAYMARVYAFYISPEEMKARTWAPESYADAEAGIVRHIDTGEIRSTSLVGGQGEDGWVHLVVSSSPVLLVAVDPVNRFYGYRTIEYMVPLPRLVIPVHFQLWRTEPYTDSLWWMAPDKSEEPDQDEGDESDE